jgi:copper transport protein
MRRVPASLAGLLLGLLAPLAAPAIPASAHAAFVSSTPAPGSVVATPPAEVVLTFSEPVRLVPGRTRAVAPDGKRINAGEPRVDGAVLRVRLRAGADRPGTYLLSYRVLSADNHPVGGGITFAVGAPSKAPPQAAEDEGGADPAVRLAIAVARFIGYAGLVLFVGPLFVLAGLWPRRLPRRDPVRLAMVGAGLIAASTLAALWLQAPYVSGAGPFDVTPGELGQVVTSRFGVVLLARLALLAIVVALIRPVIRRTAGPNRRTARIAAAVVGVAGLLTWPLSGHPVASPVPAATTIADTVHLAGMAVWLGGLCMLVVFLLRRASTRELAVILPGWSRLATVTVCWLLLGGAVQALVEVGTLGALFGSGYGRLVLAKVGLVAAVLAAAVYSRRLVRHRLAATTPGRLRRNVWIELAVTAVVLGVSATLVQSTPGRVAADAGAGPAGAGASAAPGSGFGQTLRSPLYTLQFDVYPVQLGENNTLHLYAYTPAGAPAEVLEWRVSAALPAMGIEPVDTPVLPVRGNHAIGAVTFPVPGEWQLRFTLRVSEIDQATVTATVTLR